jgi:hypothetical protein
MCYIFYVFNLSFALSKVTTITYRKKDHFRAGVKQIVLAIVSGEKETEFGIQGYPELERCCLLLER